jgi:predicted DNA-binding transcriptional regulator AlpA
MSYAGIGHNRPPEPIESVTSPKSIRQFCQTQGLSVATLYNLIAIGRAPRITRLGGRRFIYPPDEAAWVEQIRANPIEGGIRPAAEASRAARDAA